MSEYLPLISALLGAVIGGAIGFASAYLIQKQRFKREDKVKIFEKVYGTLYPLLRKARMRYDYDEYQWPGEFLLSPKEVVKIDGIIATYSHLIPHSIQQLWLEAKKNGPSFEGIGEAESDNIFGPFDLQKMFDVVENEISSRKKICI